MLVYASLYYKPFDWFVRILIAGEWDFKGPGFTAIAHPAPVNLAKNHGVFVLEDMISSWKTYKKGKVFCVSTLYCGFLFNRLGLE